MNNVKLKNLEKVLNGCKFFIRHSEDQKLKGNYIMLREMIENFLEKKEFVEFPSNKMLRNLMELKKIEYEKNGSAIRLKI